MNLQIVVTKMDTKHKGGCLCGLVRYQVTGEPKCSVACHCKQCQLSTGTPFYWGAYFLDTQVESIDGVLKQFEYTSDESGRWLRLEFCDNCGTTVTGTSEYTPGERWFAVGTFDDPDWVDIKTHIWTKSVHHSVVIPPNATTFPGEPP